MLKLPCRLFTSQLKKPRLGASRPASALASNASVLQGNQELKIERQETKDEKFYIKKMSEKRIEKIGGRSLLDKQWADRPINVIKNPHKLTEVELYRTLEKIVEMPEKRLRSMLKAGDHAIDEVFLLNIAERIPQFLTATLVKITTTLLLQRDYFKDHGIWAPLEAELFKRRTNLNNDQLADVMYAFGISGNGQKEFYYEMEEVIVDSPIPIEVSNLWKILQGYTQIDQGSPVFYSMVTEAILKRGLENLDVVTISEIAKALGKATNC